jgi:hypothetical protein
MTLSGYFHPKRVPAGDHDGRKKKGPVSREPGLINRSDRVMLSLGGLPLHAAALAMTRADQGL